MVAILFLASCSTIHPLLPLSVNEEEELNHLKERDLT